MPSRQALMTEWIESGAIAGHDVEEALKLTGLRPTAAGWRHFIDLLLLWLGVLALATAAVFFIAYNWNELGRFARFAMVEAALLAAVLAYWKFRADTVKGEAALVAAAILLGVLLALFGQTYQTGADPWQLFATWAVLLLPWAVVGRSRVIWLLFLALLNVAAILYYQVFRGIFGLLFGNWEPIMWILFVLNTAAWATWEALGTRIHWLAGRWPVRLIALASGTAVTFLVLHAIFADEANPVAGWLVYAAWLAVLHAVYRRRRPDLFMLAGACLTLIVTVTAFVAWLVMDFEGVGHSFFLLTILVIGMAATAATWLRRVHQEFETGGEA